MAAAHTLSRDVDCDNTTVTLTKLTKGLNASESTVCSDFYTSCCKNRQSNIFCQMGEQLALAGQKCRPAYRPNAEAQESCCQCCKQGKDRALQGLHCTRQVDSRVEQSAAQVYCRNVERDCCDLSNQVAELYLLRIPPKGAITSAPTAAPTGTTCASIKCDSVSTLGCIVFQGKSECACKDGFIALGSDVTKCYDVDECEAGHDECDKTKQTCQNTAGNYTCIAKVKCDPGYKLENSKCVDRDECLDGSQKCRDDYFCFNTEGSYQCYSNCPEKRYQSFRNKGKRVCKDVNECEGDPKICVNPNFKCVNRIGSYKCVRTKCQSGLRLVGQNCLDNNECVATPGICGPGRCYNTHGGFYCYCNTGYKWSKDAMKCVDRDECKIENGYCSHACKNTVGSFVCSCPSGYKVHRNGYWCVDVDECQQDNICQTGEKCINTFGSHKCVSVVCNNNYFKASGRDTKCSKRPCKYGDESCQKLLVQSYTWVAYKFYSTMKPESFKFIYRVRGYSYDYVLSFKLVEGNSAEEFAIIRNSREEITITNVQQVTGPREVKLVLHTNLERNGVTVHRYVYTFYLILAKYSF